MVFEVTEAFITRCPLLLFQVCEKCPNVKFEREGYFVTVDIEKGMQDGQVSYTNLLLECSRERMIKHIVSSYNIV